jgi:hypothetical protein
MSFSPQNFLANINRRGGLARPNRYEVILPIPGYINNFVTNSVVDRITAIKESFFKDITSSITNTVAKILGQDPMDPQEKTSNPEISRYLAAQCELAELPGKTMKTTDVRIYGPTFKVPFQAQYNDINLTFLCTNTFAERKLFDRWMEAIIPSDTNNPRFPKGEKSSYMTNITIVQYDEMVNRIYAVQLIDAFPIGIAPQALSWSDDNFHRLTVNFAYQRYKVVYDSQFGSAGDLLGRLEQSVGNKANALMNKIF